MVNSANLSLGCTWTQSRDVLAVKNMNSMDLDPPLCHRLPFSAEFWLQSLLSLFPSTILHYLLLPLWAAAGVLLFYFFSLLMSVFLYWSFLQAFKWCHDNCLFLFKKKLFLMFTYSFRGKRIDKTFSLTTGVRKVSEWFFPSCQLSETQNTFSKPAAAMGAVNSWGFRGSNSSAQESHLEIFLSIPVAGKHHLIREEEETISHFPIKTQLTFLVSKKLSLH